MLKINNRLACNMSASDEESSFMVSGASNSSSIDPGISTSLQDKPSFATAFGYSRDTLPRRVDDSTQPTGYRLAKPGEIKSKSGEPAVLYDPIFMDAKSIDEFGTV